jgi:hypothetical protein
MISALRVPTPYHLETETEAAGTSIPSRSAAAESLAHVILARSPELDAALQPAEPEPVLGPSQTRANGSATKLHERVN